MSAAQEASNFGLQETVCRHPCSVLNRRLFPLLSPRFLFLLSSQAAAPIRDVSSEHQHLPYYGQPRTAGGEMAMLGGSYLIITQACSELDGS